MTKLERPDSVPGTTYKLRWLEGLQDETYYLTITNIEYKGKLRPFEVFFTSTSPRHYPWMTALARMISAVFRRGENVKFVATELQEVFDPRGPQHVAGAKHKSLLSYIGKVIEQHMVDIGYLEEMPWPVEDIKLKELHTTTPKVEVTQTTYERGVGEAIVAKEKSPDYPKARQHKEDLDDFDVRF